MMTLEHLSEQKAKYQERADYFKKLGFDVLASDFQGMIELINEMKKYMEENTSD